MIISPALKRWGPSRRQGLCSHPAHFRSTFDSVPRFEEPPSGKGYVATRPICGPFLMFLPPLWSVGEPLDVKGYVATRPICGPLLIGSPVAKRWRPPRWQRLCSHPAHLWATADCAPYFEGLGTLGGRVYVATHPTCGQLLIRSPALKRGGPPRRLGLCSHPAHLWAISDYVCPLSSVGDHLGGRGYIATCPTCGYVPCFEALGTPQGDRGYVATRPICGPLLIRSPALMRWGPP